MSNLEMKKKLLVLELGHLSSTALSGGDLLFRQLLPYLKKDYEISVLIPEIASAHWREAKKNNSVQIIKLPPEPFPLGNNFLYALAYLNRIWRAQEALKHLKIPDIILSTNNVITDIVPAFLYKQKHPKVKWLARIHHLRSPFHKRPGNLLTNFFSNCLQIFELKLLKKADLVIALNENLKTELVKRGFEKNQLKTLGAGIDLKRIKKHKTQNRYQFDAVWVGRLHATKGVFDLPHIWQQVNKKLPQAKLAIIGEARKKNKIKLEQVLKEKGVEKNIRILGYLSNQKLLDILKTSKIFLMTDHEAGWSLATTEAMACGLPVIAYQNPIFGSVFIKGFLTVPLKNRESFSNKTIKLLKNESLRNKLKTNALYQANEFSIEKIAKKFTLFLSLNPEP